MEGGQSEQSGGLLGRWENVRTRPSMKKMVPCEAATAEYMRHEYLKPQHLPASHVDGACNYAAAPDMNSTRFHRGFQRKHRADIQSDAPRLAMELQRDYQREQDAQMRAALGREMQEKHTFNILTGEGTGRESEFRAQGKRIVNPFGCMPAVYADHDREAQGRMRASKHRYFDHNQPEPSDLRSRTLFDEGLVHTKKESTIIGYGHTIPRCKSHSAGVADNFAHTRSLRPAEQWEERADMNSSQIVFG
mmetsp:Transcript_8078/g.17060  ORF Transcript_8078/g.17060 Transcript_8078/m.17060 type:complete len:248 (-) Transcript_8078:120-863(-)